MHIAFIVQKIWLLKGFRRICKLSKHFKTMKGDCEKMTQPIGAKFGTSSTDVLALVHANFQAKISTN